MPPTYANGHISATGDPIHFMLGSGVVFGDGGSNGGIYCSNKSKMAATAILEKFQKAISPQPVVQSTSCFVLGWGFRGRRGRRGRRFSGTTVFGGSNGAIFDSNKFKMAAAAILDNFEWPYLPNSYLYSAHRAVIFAIAQFSCSFCVPSQRRG